MINEVIHTVELTRERSGWPISRTLAFLGVPASTYYRVRKLSGLSRPKGRQYNPYEILLEERTKIVEYALANPNPRHRELAWKMVDEHVVAASPATVYRVLLEEGLIPTWETTDEREELPSRQKAMRPDERWQTDLTYLKIKERWYYLIHFIDTYSRYITHHNLLTAMDRNTVSLEAETAVSTLQSDRKPEIQTDNGPAFISREFKRVLSRHGLAHNRIEPHCPEQNGIVERSFRTIKEKLDERELNDVTEAEKIIDEVIDDYNNRRYHSSLHYLRPVDYYRGNPEELLEARRLTLAQARQRRREINMQRKQVKLYVEEEASRIVAVPT